LALAEASQRGLQARHFSGGALTISPQATYEYLVNIFSHLFYHNSFEKSKTAGLACRL